MSRLNELRRAEIITTYNALKSIRKTAHTLSINVKTVQRWLKRYSSTGNIKAMLNAAGRRRIMSDDTCALAEQLLLSNEHGSLSLVAQELYRLKGIRAHPSTISRSVKAFCKRMGRPIHSTSKKPAKQLTADTMRKRLQFAQANLTRNWSTVMFTDRCKFHHTYVGGVVRRTVWKRVGSERTAPRVNHASCYNVYAGITKYGVTKMHIVAGTTRHVSTFTNRQGDPAKNITGQEYEQVVSRTLLPEGRRLFGGAVGVSSWTLQQDNDPNHKKASQRAIQAWNARHPGNTVSVLSEWPPNSPDLNPIENVWAYVQAEVNKAGCRDFASFSARVEEIFSNLSRRHLSNLFGSMRKRLEEVVSKNGGKTRY
jgi:transposase